MAAHPSRYVTAAWKIVLISWGVAGLFGTDAASCQVSTPSGVPPISGSDAAECARREAIAASIAKLEAARATKTPFDELLRQTAEIEKRMLELNPGTGRTCPDELTIVGLSERFDPIRQE